MKKMFKRSQGGFTLVEIMIVVAIIGILIAIAVPGFIHARTESRAKACIENLTKIDGAKEEFHSENNLAVGAACTIDTIWLADGTSYLKGSIAPTCPAAAGVGYAVNVIGTAPTCPVVAANATHVLP